MDDLLAQETANLVKAWGSKTKEELKVYLVHGFQDPRLSIQRILTRHFFAEALWPEQFEDLMRAELRHAVRLNSQLNEGMALTEDHMNMFGQAWNSALCVRRLNPCSALEVACGSANDYRFFETYGFVRHLNYTGIDLNVKNIENAREMFPAARFEVANVFELVSRREKFDYVLISDLFEHLSFRAIEEAVYQVCAVAQRGLVINFFNMSDSLTCHTYRAVPERHYYWHTLSLSVMKHLFTVYARKVYTFKMVDFVPLEFDYYDRRVTFFVAVD